MRIGVWVALREIRWSLEANEWSVMVRFLPMEEQVGGCSNVCKPTHALSCDLQRVMRDDWNRKSVFSQNFYNILNTFMDSSEGVILDAM